MFKRNKVQGKHAAHAKQDTQKNTKKDVSGELPWHEIASADIEETIEPNPVASKAISSELPNIDVPQTKPKKTKKITLPKVEPLSGQKTVRMSPVVPKAEKSAPGLIPPIEETGTEAVGFFVSEPSWDNAEKKKLSIDKKKVGIITGSILGVLLLIYLIGIGVFAGRFYPSTEIGSKDISMKSVDEVASIIDEMGTEYAIAVSGQGLNFTIASSDMGIKVDGKKIAQAAHDSIPSWGWPVYVFGHKNLVDSLVAEYNAGGLKDVVGVEVDEWNKEASDPTDATIAYDDGVKEFKVSSEVVGTKLDSKAVLEAVDKAVIAMDPKVEITKKQLLQPAVFSDDKRLAQACETANGYIKANLDLKMNGVDAGTIDADQISDWVALDDDLEAVFDEEEMDSWLMDLGNSLDTIGSERTYTRPDGKEVTVEGGTYGWEVDSASLVSVVRDAILDGTQGDIDIPVIVAGVYYNTDGGPDWADYLDVDLSEQHARFITEEGDVIWESDVVTGRPDGEHDTPTGVWTLFSMQSPATLKGDIQVATGQPEYETKVQYWMPFTYSGCGFHDATWQPAFGGSLYSQGYGSHGCVNLPYDAAADLYSKVSIGLPVSVHW